MPLSLLPVRRFFLLALFSVFGMVSTGFAQPAITGVSPGALKPGEAIDLTITGSNLAGATSLWTSFPAEVSLAPDVPENGKKADRVVFRVKATDPGVVGVHAIRVVTPAGASSMRLLAVDDLPSLAQQAGNTSPEKAQPVSLPMAVDGRLDNLTLNYYRFTAEAGQKLSIEVLARRIGSALDPMIRLFKADGQELDYSDDSPGLLGDARLCHTFAEAGEYILEVRDIRFQGGGAYYYRLRLGSFPCINLPYPLGVQRGQSATLEFVGPDVEGVEPLAINVPSDPQRNWLSVGAKRAGGSASGFAMLSVGDAEELLETEPNDTKEQAQKVSLSANYNGRLQQPGDMDRYSFSAKKGEKYTFAAVTRRQGSPADLVLEVLKPDGGAVGRSDDADGEDAVLNVTIPADGDYMLVVEDLHGRGGPEFAYRIAVSETQPGATLEALADTVNVPQGGVAMIPLIARRSNFNGPIAVRVEGLPEGITALPTVIGAGQKGINLCLKSTDAAASGQLHEVKIFAGSAAQPADLSPALKSLMNQMPYPPGHLLESLAVAVAPKAPFSLRTEPEKITFGRNLSTTFKVIATRQDDYKEPITLAVANINDGGNRPVPSLPGNITAALKPIPQSQNEIEVTLTANDKAPEGEFTISLEGSLKKGNATIKQPVSLFLRLDSAYQLSIEPETIALKPGEKQKIQVKIERNPAFKSPVEVTLKNLPAGVTAPKATIAADQSSVEIELTAAADAKAVSANNITAEGQGAQGNAKFNASSTPVGVKLE